MRYLALVVVLLYGLEAQAQPTQSHDAAVLEFVIGSISSLGVGIGGALAGYSIKLPDVEACRRRLSCEGKTFCLDFCEFEAFPYAMWGYVIGVPVGATLGVSLVGYWSGASGNFLLASIGAGIGEAVGIASVLYASNLLQGKVDSTQMIWASLLVIPAFSSLGATLGFNIGARHYESSSLSWSLPIITWRF
ncbi:MAG: hypothetical protein K6T71_07660 [Candidatus Bipolaricaulota bacterium]|nr:hypothetical protein [Candidatus Bipolaricaulota bacterium]